MRFFAMSLSLLRSSVGLASLSSVSPQWLQSCQEKKREIENLSVWFGIRRGKWNPGEYGGHTRTHTPATQPAKCITNPHLFLQHGGRGRHLRLNCCRLTIPLVVIKLPLLPECACVCAALLFLLTYQVCLSLLLLQAARPSKEACACLEKKDNL